MSRDLIRWLHLSDFHVGKDPFGQGQLFKYIIDNVLAKVEAGEGPHLIFITGDIANAGLASEYKLFEEGFLKPLRELVSGDCRQRIFIVPGNHDVDRTRCKVVETHGVLSRVPTFFDPTPEGCSDRKGIFERFEAFANWDAAPSTAHWLFSEEGAFCKTPKVDGHSVGILGVNTAWLACNDRDRHQLSAGKGIIEVGLEKLEDCDVRIVLGHHPLNWFLEDEEESVPSLMGKYNVLYLHGHLHKTKGPRESGAGRPFQPIQSGAAFDAREDERWVNRFLWCTLDLDGGRVIAEPLKWSRDDQQWRIDADAFLPELQVPGQNLWAISLPGKEPPPPTPRIWNVPHSRNPNFTGREDLLKGLHERLICDKTATLTQPEAICGLGGVGKTQLAIEYAYRHETDYSIIWWVQAQDQAQMASDYAELAKPLNLPLKDDPDQPLIVTAVREWLRRNDGWLLVFDNAEEPGEVQGFLPETDAGRVILTSRNPNWRGIGAEPFSVDVLPPDEAVALLLRRSGQMDEAAAGGLTKELGYLPLALEQAGAYMEATATPISEYLDLLREHGTKVFQHSPKNKDYPDSVVTTWEISFRRVEQISPAAADMLNFFAFLGPENIPRDLLQKGFRYLPKSLADVCGNRLEYKFAIGALRRYSLISGRPEGLSVHRLVQAVIRDRLSEEDRNRWAAVAVRVMDAAFPTKSQDPRTWPDCAVLLPHAVAAADHADLLGMAEDETAAILKETSAYLGSRGEFASALVGVQRALSIARKALGPEHPNVAAGLDHLGLVLQALGRFDEAKTIHEKALFLEQKLYGPEHLRVARTLGNLGNALVGLNRINEAIEKLEKALFIEQRNLGPKDPRMAGTLGNLAIALAGSMRFKEARGRFEQALAIQLEVLGPEHVDVAKTHNNLGPVLEGLGLLPQAKEEYEMALAIQKKVLGPEHPNVATSLNNLGMVLKLLGRFGEAKKKFELALEIFRKRLGEEHPHTQMVLNNLRSLKPKMP